MCMKTECSMMLKEAILAPDSQNAAGSKNLRLIEAQTRLGTLEDICLAGEQKLFYR